jgi:hypothetical protein
MSRITRFLVVGVIAVLAGPGRSADARGAGPAEDDLTIVRRAVAQAAAARSETPPAPEPPRTRKAEPQWLKVRIKEKGGKSTVSVNLPLALARALGDEVPLDLACRRNDSGHSKIKLSDVLASLDSGQDIVQVDSEDGSVRVWVE